MKKTQKLWMLGAMFLAALLTFGFTSCGDNDDEDDSKSKKPYKLSDDEEEEEEEDISLDGYWYGDYSYTGYMEESYISMHGTASVKMKNGEGSINLSSSDNYGNSQEFSTIFTYTYNSKTITIKLKENKQTVEYEYEMKEKMGQTTLYMYREVDGLEETFILEKKESDPQPVSIPFEVPYTIWGVTRSTVKTNMANRGYDLIADQESDSSNGYPLVYSGKYQEELSMYMFDASKRLNISALAFKESIISSSTLSTYLTNTLGYTYEGSQGSYYYFSTSSSNTIVCVYTTEVDNTPVVYLYYFYYSNGASSHSFEMSRKEIERLVPIQSELIRKQKK